MRHATSAVLTALLVLAAVLVVAPAAHASASTFASARVPVILDTDIYSSADDAGAEASLFALDLLGEANVLAVGVNTRADRPQVATSSWRCVAAIAQFYGYPNVPIGADMPDDGPAPAAPNDWITPCAAFASPTTPAPLPAVQLYRQVLAAQPDDSVVIVCTGYEENIDNLLNSPADAISSLTGSQLVAQKVKSLVIMGGAYPTSTGENNFEGNAGAAADVATNWPTTITYSGYEVGSQILTGETVSSVHPADSPVRAAIEAFSAPNHAIASFDLTAAYYAVRPSDPSLTPVGPGTNAVGEFGDNTFTTGTGDEYYLDLTSATNLDASLETLWDTLPGTTDQGLAFSSTAPSASVGDTYAPTVTAGATGNPVTLTIDPSSTSGCTIDSSSLVTFSAPYGSCVIDANEPGDTTYAPGVAHQTVSVSGLTQRIGFTSSPPANPLVNGTYDVTATGGGSANPVTFSIDGSSTSGCTISGAQVTFGGPAGTCVIDANQLGDTTYAPASQVEQTVDVGKLAQSIGFTSSPPASPVVNGTYDVSATGGGSANPVTFSIDASSTSGCTISGAHVTFGGPAGTCVIDANQLGDGTYDAASQVQQTIDVAKLTQSIAFTSTAPAHAVVNDSYDVTATGGASANPVTFSIDGSSTSGCTISGAQVTFAGPAGSCVIDANQLGDGTYDAASQVQQTVDVAKLTQSISFTSTPPPNPVVDGTYTVTAKGGGSANPVTFSIDGTSTSGCTVTGSLVTFSPPSGTCVIDANQPGNGDFDAANVAQQTIDVAKLAQSIAFTSTPPSNPVVNGAYDVAASGGASANPVTFSIDGASTSGCSISGAQVTFEAPAGTCVIDANQSGDGAYAAAPQAQQTIDVAKLAQSITFTSTPPANPVVNGTYDVAATGGASANPVTFSIDGSSTSGCTISGTEVTFDAPTGTCVIDANQVGDDTYAAAAQAQQSVDIAGIPQTIEITSVAPASVQVGGATYTPTATSTSGGAVTVTLDATSTGCDLAAGVVRFVAVGTCAIDFAQAGSAVYLPVTTTQLLAVAKGTPTLTVAPRLPGVAHAGTRAAARATSSTGDPVRVTLAGGSTGCAIDRGAVVFRSVGRCALRFTDAGNAEYASAAVLAHVRVVRGRVRVSASAAPATLRRGATTVLRARLSVPFASGVVAFTASGRHLCAAPVRHGVAACRVRVVLARGVAVIVASYRGSPSFAAARAVLRLRVR